MQNQTKPTFTPGPWINYIDTSTANHETTIRATKENGFTQICEVNRFVDVKLGGANAALIAAAPSLFSVLDTFSQEDLDWSSDVISSFLEQARYALSKARGE